MDAFCKENGIRREYSVARTPQQNGVAKRRNRTLIKVARTMLADSKLPTTFWAEAVSTACYVQNRVLIVKPHNKTPYELFRGTQGDLNTGTSTQQDQVSQDCIVMPIWKDTSYFDSSTTDDRKKVKDGSHNEYYNTKKSKDNSSLKDVGTADQQVNTASPGVNTGSSELSTAFSKFNTVTPEDVVGPKHTLEATQVEFFNDQDDQEVDLGNDWLVLH
ncbi:putative ribonuclease H-like domain-containing protein [Tanacetum coccineum]